MTRCYTRAMQNPPARIPNHLVSLAVLAGMSFLSAAAFGQEPAPMPMSHDNDMVASGLPKRFRKADAALHPKALGKFTRPISSTQ